MKIYTIILITICAASASYASTNKVSRHFPVVVGGVSYDILLAYIENAETSLVESHSPMIVVKNNDENKNSKYPSIRINRDGSFTLIANEEEEFSIQGDLLLYYEDRIEKFIILSSGVNLVDSESIEIGFKTALLKIKSIHEI